MTDEAEMKELLAGGNIMYLREQEPGPILACIQFWETRITQVNANGET